MLAVSFLVAGIVTMFLRPARVALWVGPTSAAVIGLLTTVVDRTDATDALRLLRNPLLFLVFAVPLALLLDHIGVFAALAAAVGGRPDRHGARLALWLWVLAAAVTIVFNLDASVVLLTPLYIRIAQRHGIAPEALAFQPAILACLASNVLPVSNLTNLVVAEQFDLGVGDFVRHLALPTAVACTVGWFTYRRAFHLDSDGSGIDEPVDAGALRRGLPIVGFVLIGFTVGDALGIPAFVIAAIAVVWAMALTREVPWRSVPYEAILVAASLAVLVAGAVPHLGVDRLLDGGGLGGRARALGFGVVAANSSNNLPAVLAGSSALHDRAQVWALLVGVNMGPVLVLTGALSGLLWRDTARRLGVEVTARRYSAVGLRAGLPALLAAAAVVLLVA